ncbi:hypothetical protein ACJJIE_00210 (plasmid) [Microbulbifer sp. TRSA001]|uniref:hypothetical protein n=1 Tax=Microbulbifer sp. TRSA001 TaxID=3243381 RepID=UPI004039A5FE
MRFSSPLTGPPRSVFFRLLEGGRRGMNGQEAGSTGVMATGVGLTQVPSSWLQMAGILIAGLGLIWNVYAVITRNKHNKFVREQHEQQRDINESP